jgi:hypothetical protein
MQSQSTDQRFAILPFIALYVKCVCVSLLLLHEKKGVWAGFEMDLSSPSSSGHVCVCVTNVVPDVKGADTSPLFYKYKVSFDFLVCVCV